MEDQNQQLAPMLPVFKRSHVNTQQTFLRALLELGLTQNRLARSHPRSLLCLGLSWGGTELLWPSSSDGCCFTFTDIENRPS